MTQLTPRIATLFIVLMAATSVIKGQYLPPGGKLTSAGRVKRVRSMRLSKGKPFSKNDMASGVAGSATYIKDKNGRIVVAASAKKPKVVMAESWGWSSDAVFSPLD
mmetsp:Transcript_3913/g.5295  ORF Transcript_3913/g.5295 Transcript_3913/m.5295 type:complete len:106 (+) Transcript_3913:267-584(+)|eukprot:CAMPEP_0116050086 /NCGR_PEP_ID=MMETSP0322-20121206/172_1 /TAXON_ID=163516 /ORGANISM="Leptocylindrus danicus var. apora, Strain B651" /LENGTH=105 /DNA_ID=CAMNT_0003532571 /DNA_START=108 /DNA_END=425 /DNA_ORIENTATION=+